MKNSITAGLLAGLLAFGPMSGAWADSGLLGHWACNGGATRLNFSGPNTLIFDGERSSYQLMPNTIVVQEEYGMVSYPYQLNGEQLAIQFPDGSLLQCDRARGGSAPRQAASPSSANNAVLAQQIAGTWWGYSGATETKIGLCPGGRYLEFSESGYSGHSYDSAGAETMAWGTAGQGGRSGRWTIQGDTQRGVIAVQGADGSTFTLRYRQIGEPGCLDINGSRLCRTSASCQ